MSTGVQDQRKTTQVQGNASSAKEGAGAAEQEDQYDAWRLHQQQTQHPQQQQPLPPQQQPPQPPPPQAYSTSMSAMAQTDPYMSSYYGGAGGYPPYHAFGLGDGAWSNGGADQLAFMGGYGGQVPAADSYAVDGMFGGGQQGFGGFGGQPFNYGPFHGGSGEYSAWGDSRKYDDYYRGDPAAYGADQRAVKQVQQGMQGLSMDAKQEFGGDVTPPDGPQKKSWANIASQPARPGPVPGKPPGTTNGGGAAAGGVGNGREAIGTWDGKNGGPPKPAAAAVPAPAPRPAWTAPRGGRGGLPPGHAPMAHHPPPPPPPPPPSHPVLDDLRGRNEYNPREFDLSAKNARFFVIKSYSEDDIHRSIKYEIWCSTEHGNRRLDAACRERDAKGPVYLLFSVNGSGHFCGMAQMLSCIDYSASSSVWAQDKWKGQFKVRWIYVKDVPNSALRHIRLENNENKPVTNSRDTQEVPPDKGRQVLKIIHGYGHRTSIFDDFVHYEQRQEEEEGRKPHARVAANKADDEPSGAAPRSEPRGERGRGGRGRRN